MNASRIMKSCECPTCNAGTARYRFGRFNVCAKHSRETIANLKWAATLYGSIVDDEGERFGSLNLDAPHGHIWDANGCHTLAVVWYHNQPAEAIRDAIDRLNYGYSACDDPECEFCTESHD